MRTAETYRGRPCKRGHIVRYASNNNCVECKRESDRIRFQNPEMAERQRQHVRKYRATMRAKERGEVAVVRVNVTGWGCRTQENRNV